jgi:hypothetical protein
LPAGLDSSSSPFHMCGGTAAPHCGTWLHYVHCLDKSSSILPRCAVVSIHCHARLLPSVASWSGTASTVTLVQQPVITDLGRTPRRLLTLQLVLWLDGTFCGGSAGNVCKLHVRGAVDHCIMLSGVLMQVVSTACMLASAPHMHTYRESILSRSRFCQYTTCIFQKQSIGASLCATAATQSLTQQTMQQKQTITLTQGSGDGIEAMHMRESSRQQLVHLLANQLMQQRQQTKA